MTRILLDYKVRGGLFIMGGRPRKSVAELKLNGVYRADRHKEREQSETQIAQTCFQEGTEIVPPPELTDQFVIDYYKFHTAQLIAFKILSPADIPLLNSMYFSLQQLRDVERQIKKTDMVSDFDKYERLTKLAIKLGNRFTDLARNFYITPTARTRLQLDNLELETKSVQSQSIIQKLINAKKAQ